ncbi:MAG: putative molybdenum carrier protein [Gammaproteobacteria bacterium]|nr:putative molybdenum carrier protein [Gammaproteobacteria bacterium]
MSSVGRIVSGGQTGADRAALDVAKELGLDTGGWVPRGRRAEDGRVPDHYKGLTETDSRDYAQRTRLNVRDSDATVVFSFGRPTGGTALTVRLAEALDKPLLVLDLEAHDRDESVQLLRVWIETIRPAVVNVAGPRASGEPRIMESVHDVLRGALTADQD